MRTGQSQFRTKNYPLVSFNYALRNLHGVEPNGSNLLFELSCDGGANATILIIKNPSTTLVHI